MLTLFQLLAVSVTPRLAHSMRSCPDPDDKKTVSGRPRKIVIFSSNNNSSPNSALSTEWAARGLLHVCFHQMLKKSWQSRLMMKTLPYLGFCVCLWLTHVLPHRLTSKPRSCIRGIRRTEKFPHMHYWETHLLPRSRCAPRRPSR